MAKVITIQPLRAAKMKSEQPVKSVRVVSG